MRVTDDVLAVGGHEFVLAVLEPSPLMRTAIDIRENCRVSAQHEDRHAASLIGVETPRDPGLQLIESTQADRRHRVSKL